MRRRIFVFLIFTTAWGSSPAATQERLGQAFDRAYPAVVQVLVAAPDSIRQGSGFVVDTDGVVLTYLPLLEDARTIFVRPSSEESYYRAHVLAVDASRDIAALQVATETLPALEIVSATELRTGARLTAVGLTLDDTDPVVSAVVRSQLPDAEGYLLDAAPRPSPGLNGAPLLAEDGGVVAMLVSRSEDARTGAVAQPLEPARDFLEELGVEAASVRSGRVAGAESAARQRSQAARRPVPSDDAADVEPSEASADAPVVNADAPGARRADEDAPITDLSGRWIVENTIQHTPHPPYEGLRLGFELTLRQDGERVTGEGRKITENGRSVAPAARSPIWVEGTLEGNTLTATFRERGARRTINGLFSWFVDPAGDELGGRFADTGALTRGESRGRRVD